MSTRLCPGCRALDGEHDFGPTCTLAEPETEPRVPGCQCQWEAGDSPCRIHGEEEPDKMPHALTGATEETKSDG